MRSLSLSLSLDVRSAAKSAHSAIPHSDSPHTGGAPPQVAMRSTAEETDPEWRRARNCGMAAEAAKQVKALRRLLDAPGLDDIAIKSVSEGLRSDVLGVVEAAAEVCSAHAGAGVAAPLSHAWPRAPPPALPVMAVGLVTAAQKTGDGGMLMRLASSRPDGGGELAAAVSEALELRPESWASMRAFVVNFLFHGSGLDAQHERTVGVAVSDAYARVRLHEAAVNAASANLDSVRDVALLPLCYAGGGDSAEGWSWINTSLQQLRVASSRTTGNDGSQVLRLLLPRLCVHSALELALAHRSAIPPLRLLGEALSSSAGATSVSGLQQLLVASVHLLCLLPGVRERELLLKALQQLAAAGTLRTCEAPMLGILVAAVMREQHSGDGAGTAAKLEAERLLPSLVKALSEAKPASSAGVESMTKIEPLSAWLGRTQHIATGLWRCWATLDALDSGGSQADATREMETWFSSASKAAMHVGDAPQQSMVGICSASLLLHRSNAARLVVISVLRRSAQSDLVPASGAMGYLAVALQALQVGVDTDAAGASRGSAQAALLHLIPVIGALSGSAARATFRFLKQLLFGGLNIDVCCTLLCTFWLARRNASGADEVFDALSGAIRSAAAATAVTPAEMQAHSAMMETGRTYCLACRTEVSASVTGGCPLCGSQQSAMATDPRPVAAAPVAAAACLLRVCEAAPHEGLPFIATIMALLAHGRANCASTAPIALECLATMTEAGELAPLALVKLLRTTFDVRSDTGSGWASALYGTGSGQSDAGGAALVRCLACVVDEYRLPVESLAEGEDNQKAQDSVAAEPPADDEHQERDAIKKEYDEAVVSVAAFEEVVAALSRGLLTKEFPAGRSGTRAQIFDTLRQFVENAVDAECLRNLTQGVGAAELLRQEITSAATAAVGGTDGVAATWESVAACESYVVAVLHAQAESCWRSGDKGVFPKGLELGQRLVDLSLAGAGGDSTAKLVGAASIRCLSGAQALLPVDLPALLSKQGYGASLPPADAFDNRQREGSPRTGAIMITPTVSDVLNTYDPAARKGSSGGLRQVYGFGAHTVLAHMDTSAQPAAPSPTGSEVVTELGANTEFDHINTVLGVLDQLGICDPSTDSSSSGKWNTWLAQLEHAVEAAAALAFGVATGDQTLAAPAAPTSEREREVAAASDLARLLLYAPGWAESRAGVLARALDLLTERVAGGAG